MADSLWSERTTALSAVFQATSLVETLAKTGRIAPRYLRVMIDSLFIQNPDKAMDVYGDIDNLDIGMSALTHMLERQRTKTARNILPYVMSVLHLQKELTSNSAMMQVIASRLQQAHKQLEYFHCTHDNVIANLADIYTDTIGTFRFRVQVTGERHHLQQQRIANQIRALLFSGIRAAVLWRQLRGSRLHMIFYRKRLLKCLRHLEQ